MTRQLSARITFLRADKGLRMLQKQAQGSETVAQLPWNTAGMGEPAQSAQRGTGDTRAQPCRWAAVPRELR